MCCSTMQTKSCEGGRRDRDTCGVAFIHGGGKKGMVLFQHANKSSLAGCSNYGMVPICKQIINRCCFTVQANNLWLAVAHRRGGGGHCAVAECKRVSVACCSILEGDWRPGVGGGGLKKKYFDLLCCSCPNVCCLSSQYHVEPILFFFYRPVGDRLFWLFCGCSCACICFAV